MNSRIKQPRQVTHKLHNQPQTHIKDPDLQNIAKMEYNYSFIGV